MIIPETEIADILNDVVENYLKQKFMELGMNASGDWINALEVRTFLGGGEIWGMDYTKYLVSGRSPGNRPPIGQLIRWAQYKFGQDATQAKSTAFAVANKIAREGTSYYPNGTDLLEILHSKEVTDFINKRVGRYLIEQTRIEIVRMTKETLLTS